MATLCVVAPAKINLHLEVLGLRPDGFHELAMLMQSLDLCDQLLISPAADGGITLHCDRDDLPSDGSNLIVRAAELLRRRVGLPELGARIRLTKRIPVGAGLAGGSSDAAAALLGLNALWGLGFDAASLAGFAAELGSDVPFCLAGGSQLCFGRGEILEPLSPVQRQPRGVLLLKDPGVSVSTPWAYRLCREQRGATYLQGEADFAQRRQALRASPLRLALERGEPLPELRNDLQQVVEPQVACVGRGLELLQRAGEPQAVAMSGSGPSLFAVYPDLSAAERAREAMAPELATAGFEAWCCGFRAGGVRLEPPPA